MKNAESKALKLIAGAIECSDNAPRTIESMILNECADFEDIVQSARYSEFYSQSDMLNIIREYLDVCRDNMDDEEIKTVTAFLNHHAA